MEWRTGPVYPRTVLEDSCNAWRIAPPAGWVRPDYVWRRRSATSEHGRVVLYHRAAVRPGGPSSTALSVPTASSVTRRQPASRQALTIASALGGLGRPPHGRADPIIYPVVGSDPVGHTRAGAGSLMPSSAAKSGCRGQPYSALPMISQPLVLTDTCPSRAERLRHLLCARYCRLRVLERSRRERCADAGAPRLSIVEDRSLAMSLDEAAGLAPTRSQTWAIRILGWSAASSSRSVGSWVRITPPPRRIAVATTRASTAISLPCPASESRCPAILAIRNPVVTTRA